MYLAGDAEAASLAEQLRRAQEDHAGLLDAQPPKPTVFDSISCQTVGLLKTKKARHPTPADIDEAEQALADVQQQLKHLAR
jgi:hypothetical protein